MIVVVVPGLKWAMGVGLSTVEWNLLSTQLEGGEYIHINIGEDVLSLMHYQLRPINSRIPSCIISRNLIKFFRPSRTIFPHRRRSLPRKRFRKEVGHCRC